MFLRNDVVSPSIAFAEMCYKIKKMDKVINFAKNVLQQKPGLSISEKKQLLENSNLLRASWRK